MNKYNGSAQRTAIVIGGSLGGLFAANLLCVDQDSVSVNSGAIDAVHSWWKHD